MNRISLPVVVLAVMALESGSMSGQTAERTFEDDVAFLKRYTTVVVLGRAADGAQVAVVPAWQGRVMTSTAGTPGGSSFGWINYELIASGRAQPHINAYGGEDRFWLGPEGGQFSIFFQRGDPFDLEHWQTPAVIDTEPYPIVSDGERHVSFRRRATLTNYTGTVFEVQIERRITLLARAAAVEAVKAPVNEDVRVVAYESENTITNVGSSPWGKPTGLLSIWILGMFKPSPATTIVIPYQPGPADTHGPLVNDSYFGKVPTDRLVDRGGRLFFKGDGRYRSKIGLSPRRATPVLGSYDATRSVLTLVQYTKPAAQTDYVNSMWEIQDEPYQGDVVNSYNDGPPAPGARPLGPFYELETSSPAGALAPGARMTHVHRTLHFQGPDEDLDAIARAVLGVGIETIADVFP